MGCFVFKLKFKDILWYRNMKLILVLKFFILNILEVLISIMVYKIWRIDLIWKNKKRNKIKVYRYF